MKVVGGAVSIPQAIFANSSPTASWTPRMTSRGKTAPSRSSQPVAPRTTKTTPMSSDPAAITSAPAPAAIAAAPKAFSGWTATGTR